MATEDQIAANRQNAEFSTGPRTEEGKRKSSRNAVNFGLYSASDFVRPDEAHTYQLFCQSFRKELSADGPLEETLAAEIIHAAWRLRRCSIVESELEFTESEPDPLLSPKQTAIDRARVQAQRQLLRATGELRRLQTERQIRNECLPEEFPLNSIGGLASSKAVQSATRTAIVRDKAKEIANLESAPATPVEIPTTKRTQSEAPDSRLIPRSAPCPCGSRRKYKRCCGKNAPAVLQQAA